MENRQFNSDEARRRLRDLLNAVEHDSEHVTILRYGRPSVVIVPIDWYTQAQWALEGSGSP